MDESLREDLNRAFHSTAKAIAVRKRLDKKATDTLCIFTKSRAEDLLRIRYYNIAHFVSSIFPHTDMISTVEYTIELLNEYEGAVSLLWELEVISDDTAEFYFEFCGELKVELINTRCDMFDMGYGILI